MTTKITPEAVKERIAALESAGELSLKEQFYLEALRLLVAGMDSEPVAWLLSGGGTKDVVCFDSGNAYADPLREVTPLYRHAQPVPVAPVCTCPSGDGSLRWPCPVHPGNSPVIPDGMLKIGYMFITAEGGTAFSISDVPVPGMTLAGPVYAPAVKAGGQQNAPQNIPDIIPNELIAAVNRLLDSNGSRGCYSAIKCYDAHIEVERLLAAARQEVKP